MAAVSVVKFRLVGMCQVYLTWADLSSWIDVQCRAEWRSASHGAAARRGPANRPTLPHHCGLSHRCGTVVLRPRGVVRTRWEPPGRGGPSAPSGRTSPTWRCCSGSARAWTRRLDPRGLGPGRRCRFRSAGRGTSMPRRNANAGPRPGSDAARRRPSTPQWAWPVTLAQTVNEARQAQPDPVLQPSMREGERVQGTT
jgi:hypothetical protein